MDRDQRLPLGSLLGLFAFILAFIGGCGDGLPATHSVKGKVVYKGTGQAFPGGNVMLQSVADPSVQASGELNPDGTFELYSNLGKPGTVPGEHRVLVRPPELEAGQKPILKRTYQNYDTSGITVTVNPGETNLTIEVEPPGK